LFADELLFTNGDKLTGKVERVVEGKIVFKSDVAGEVTIDFSKIQTFSTDEPVKVHLSDGTVFSQRIEQSQQDRFGIAGDSMLSAQEFALSSIASINPPVKPAPKWTGSVSVGLTSTHGNTTTESHNAGVDLSKRTEKDRTQLNADYGRASNENPDTGEKITTEDWWKTKAKYDYFFTKKFYGYLDGRYETDKIAELDRRVILGTGGGYQVVESKDINFSVESGIASLYEKYENRTNSTHNLSAQLGYHFDKNLFAGLKFINDLTYYPSTKQLSDYYLTTTAELRAPFSKRMFTNFKVIFDYDTTPALGKGSTDTKYIFGVGMNF
jgi:putative salt-induced outer membrane protein YdiY